MQRIALILLLLIVSGVAAIFAAGHLGINLPWNIAVTEHDTPSKDRDQAAAPKDAKSAPEKAVEDTTAALGGAPGQPAPAAGSVAIDISRISPDGTSVFAGRAEPNSYVTVLESGKPAGTAKVDENGEWTLSTEHKFASNDPSLTYEVSKTPPPEPEKPPAKVATAQPQQKSAAAVAGEVMRKFENLVEQAREEAKKEQEQKKPEEAKKAEPPTDTVKESPPPGEQSVAAAPQPDAGTTAGSGTTSGSGATSGSSASSGSSAASDSTSTPPEPKSPPDAAVAVAPEPPQSASSAGVKTDIIPVPIMFVYNEATLTPDGERAAGLLLEYLTLKRLTAVELTGHADERGTNEYNYDLSRERLETVSRLLRDGGYTGELKLTPKGKTEPYTGVDRSAYTGEALYQLDRRVELRVAR
jgi:outer membrane protein OmpA-like peptidoglycan-associated protein